MTAGVTLTPTEQCEQFVHWMVYCQVLSALMANISCYHIYYTAFYLNWWITNSYIVWNFRCHPCLFKVTLSTVTAGSMTSVDITLIFVIDDVTSKRAVIKLNTLIINSSQRVHATTLYVTPLYGPTYRLCLYNT